MEHDDAKTHCMTHWCQQGITCLYRNCFSLGYQVSFLSSLQDIWEGFCLTHYVVNTYSQLQCWPIQTKHMWRLNFQFQHYLLFDILFSYTELSLCIPNSTGDSSCVMLPVALTRCTVALPLSTEAGGIHPLTYFTKQGNVVVVPVCCWCMPPPTPTC